MALKGIRVLEFAGLAPAPFCGMILADFGATVIRIDKAFEHGFDVDCLGNGKLSLGVNMKKPAGVEIIKQLSKTADVLIEPFRAGVMENLGLGPKILMENNSKLIYARLSGYGQTGALSKRAGHDINFISLSGLLSMFGWRGKNPVPPINLAADFGGGGLMCALGIVIALFERERSGQGQVVDCGMLQGSAYLGSWLFRSQYLPFWGEPRGKNLLDGGNYSYDTYETKDGKWMAVGALEPQFHSTLLRGLGFSDEEFDIENGRKLLAERFKQYTQNHWIKVFSETDACVTPVLSPEEAFKNTGCFVRSSQGSFAPLPAPILSRTPASTLAQHSAISPGQHNHQILQSLGYSDQEITNLKKEGVIGPTKSKL